MSSASEPTMSKHRLPAREAWTARGLSRCMSGSPPTGRTRTRSAETSVTLGATMTWTSRSSSSQAIRRSWADESSAPPATKMTSASTSSTACRSWSGVPITGTPVPVSAVSVASGTSAPTTS